VNIREGNLFSEEDVFKTVEKLFEDEKTFYSKR